MARDLRDELGPEKIVLIREPRVGLEAVVVVDNVACGPAIGGVRMAPDVTVEEVVRLARAMTLKNAAAGLPHGGGKAGILADSTCAPDRKEALVRAFARMIRGLTEYIPGPDMGTNEACMAWISDEIGRAVGLPRVVGGIPLDEIGATATGSRWPPRWRPPRPSCHWTGRAWRSRDSGRWGSTPRGFWLDVARDWSPSPIAAAQYMIPAESTSTR